MSELGRMWSNTRLVVLTAVSAALYVALLIPFKFIQIIPGLAELRPAAAIPPLCSFLFGPAGAFGAAFGNLIGDFFGTLGPGSAFGFVGNFLYGYLPYKIYRALSDENFSWKMPLRNWLALEFSIAVSAAVCAIIIAFGVDLIGVLPEKVSYKGLANWITFNNLLFGLILCPLILVSIYSFIQQSGLCYQELISVEKHDLRSFFGIILILLGIALSLGLGNFPEPAQNILGLAGKNLGLAIVGPGVLLILIGSILI